MHTRVVRVRLWLTGTLEDCLCPHLWLDCGDHCIVGSKRGERLGTVVASPSIMDSGDLSDEGWEVLRRATSEDYTRLKENAQMERDAFEVCQKLINDRELSMKLVRVEYTFDRSQALFYFTAETRVDFRELVRDLAHQFRTRIELKQVGVRDEAKILGGIGYCGRELCCRAFLRQFQPVSKKMARDQNLTLNPSKISGICGRLLCCLVYEQATYEELRRDMPQEGASVDTPAGPGKIRGINPLKRTVDVQLATGVTKIYCCSEVQLAKAGSEPHDEAAPPEVSGSPEGPEPVDDTEAIRG